MARTDGAGRIAVQSTAARADANGRIPTAPIMPGRDRIVGVPVDRVSLEAAVAIARRVIAGNARCRIMVSNANKAWLASRDARLRAALDEAELVVPEYAMVWAARRLERRGIHHVGGIRLMQRLLAEAGRAGWSVYFLGARAEVVERLVEVQRRERPGLRIAGWHHGFLDATLDARVRSELAELRPDLLFVAMGSPRQEYWLAADPAGAGARVALGVGGSFDVLAGIKRDAPVWMRGRGLEWLFRLSQDPRRLWKRYLVTNSWFVWSVLRERMGAR